MKTRSGSNEGIRLKSSVIKIAYSNEALRDDEGAFRSRSSKRKQVQARSANASSTEDILKTATRTYSFSSVSSHARSCSHPRHALDGVVPKRIAADAPATSPCDRLKHAACIHRGFIYVHGGRDGSLPLKDLWRFHIGNHTWEHIDSSNQAGDPPGHLEGHTLVSSDEGLYDDSGSPPLGNSLYVFGGELGFCSKSETSLWEYNVESSKWTKCSPPLGSEVALPAGRRGHTAVVHSSAMHIYGGYVDLSGSSNELWTYDFAANAWHLAYGGSTRCPKLVGSNGGPAGRHNHSAAMLADSMLVHGGMANLEPCYDLWQWSFNVRCWTKVKFSLPHRRMPTQLRLISQVGTYALFFSGRESGGISNATDECTSDSLWQLNMASGVAQRFEELTRGSELSPPTLSHGVIATRHLPRAQCSSMRVKDVTGGSFVAASRQPVARPTADAASAVSRRHIRNQVTPSDVSYDNVRPSSLMPPDKCDQAHRIAFQSDSSIFAARQESTEQLLALSRSHSTLSGGLNNAGYRWSANLYSPESGWADRTLYRRGISTSAQEAITSDYCELVQARCRSRPTVFGHDSFTDVPGLVRSGSLQDVSGPAASVCRRTEGQPLLPPSELRRTRAAKRHSEDITPLLMNTPSDDWSMGHGADEFCCQLHNPCCSGDAESNATKNPTCDCCTEFYIIGGKPLYSPADLQSSGAMRPPLAIWKCCVAATGDKACNAAIPP